MLKGTCLFWLVFCWFSAPIAKQQINIDFKPYVAKFEYYSLDIVNSSIMYGKMAWPTVGECFYDTQTVLVDEKYFNKMGYLGKEELIFHELGHCELNRDHEDDMMDYCPRTIMYFQTFGDSACYAQKHEYYMDELFNIR